MNRVVFLDIDGVMRRKGAPNKIEPSCAQILHDFAEAKGLFIVISSTWRLAYSLEFFQREVSPRVIGKLPGYSWAILDDEPDLFPEARDQQRCVFVDKEILVTKQDLDRLGGLLGSDGNEGLNGKR